MGWHYFTEEERQRVEDFVYRGDDEHYPRLPGQDDENEARRRIRVGKLAEVVLWNLFVEQGRIPLGDRDMFVVWEGQHNVDATDFTTAGGQLVDVKALSKDGHRLIMVNVGQFRSRKDYYVGVRISEDFTRGRVLTYCTRAELKAGGVRNYGEGLAYAYPADRGHDIAELVAMMPKAPRDP